MTLDVAKLERLLSDRLCSAVRIHRRDDGVLMVESPFRFPDGDHFPIYLLEAEGGGVKLSDYGHTLMHVSYEHDVDSFYKGARAELRRQILHDYGIDEDDGTFSVETSPEHMAAALFRLGQGLTKIYDLTFLSRRSVPSTFYEDLHGLLDSVLDQDRLEADHIPAGVPDSHNYPVDYRFEGKAGGSVFLYGVLNRDKARLTTIMLSHFLLHDLDFDSIVVFANQSAIPRLDVARLTNVAGTAVASLDAEKDLRRKIDRLAA